MKTDKLFHRWLQVLDREQFDALTDRKVWVFILLTFVAIISTASFAPWARDFFAMQFWPVMASLLPVAICAVLVSAKPLEKGMSLQHWGWLILATTAAFQFFMWSLVIFSEVSGATVLAALPILLCAYHGESYRFSKNYLWWGVSFLPALLLAFLLAPSGQHGVIVAVGGLIAFGAAWTMGSHGVLRAEAAKERDALKAAVDAQTLLDSVSEAEAKQHLLYELRGANHDAGNALSGVLMNLDLLGDLLSQPQLEEADIEALREMNTDLRSSTNRLRELIEKGRETGKVAESRELVNVIEVAENVVAQAYKLHPSLRFKLQASDNFYSSPFIPLHGGELTLFRILENLIKNAIEGDGQQGANTVELVFEERKGKLFCAVRDDGPGFSEHQLAQDGGQIFTTKTNGTGLGIYTSQRLLLANRGELRRSNMPGGGAEVSIVLPLEKVA